MRKWTTGAGAPSASLAIGLAGVALVAVALAMSVAAQAQKPPRDRPGVRTNGPDSLCNRNGMECIVGGKTRLTLSRQFKKYLARTRTRLRVSGGATRRGDTITFPVAKNGAVGPLGNPRSFVYQQGFIDEAGACTERTVNTAGIHHSGTLQLSQRVFFRYAGVRLARVKFAKPWLLLDGSSSESFGALARRSPAAAEIKSTASPLGGKTFSTEVRLRANSGPAYYQGISEFKTPGNIPLGIARTTATVVPKKTCE